MSRRVSQLGTPVHRMMMTTHRVYACTHQTRAFAAANYGSAGGTDRPPSITEQIPEPGEKEVGSHSSSRNYDRFQMRILKSWARHKLPASIKDTPEGHGEHLEDAEALRLFEHVKRLMHEAIHLKNSTLPDRMLKDLCQDYLRLSKASRQQALFSLATNFGVDEARLGKLVDHYATMQAAASGRNATDREDGVSRDGMLAAHLRVERELRTALTPLSARLFNQINGTEGGLKFLVNLRMDLMHFVREVNHPSLRALDEILQGMLATWLSPGCMELKRITWDDPASLLEKIVAYEAVHPISNILDLKRRLGNGRRCFGYFHPAMPEEPLVFIEVALTNHMSASIQELLKTGEGSDEAAVDTAVFYSISSTQPGLSGIDLGNTLIKRVVKELQTELPHILTFVTLSPIPGFVSWLTSKLAIQSQASSSTSHGGLPAKSAHRPDAENFREDGLLLPEEEQTIISTLGSHLSDDGVSRTDSMKASNLLMKALMTEDSEWAFHDSMARALRGCLMRLCARYLLKEKRRGRALDPVTNFHVRNGARLERLNWMADTSQKGLQTGAGMMVNYLYRLDNDIANVNQENYIKTGTIATSSVMLRALL